MLPPHGACLLGSLNLVKYLVPRFEAVGEVEPDSDGKVSFGAGHYEFDLDLLRRDVRAAVRAFDNVIDISTYPLEEQEREAKAKRRMGLGVTGVANALELTGARYASDAYLDRQDQILETIRDEAIRASIDLAKEKGPFPLFDADGWLSSGFAATLPEELRHDIAAHGLRNGCLLSIAPTGTISLAADNVSSGIEPLFAITADRKIRMADGEREFTVEDYAWAAHGVRGLTATEVAPAAHVDVLCRAQKWIDNVVSKTCNVRGVRGGGAADPGEISFADFKDLYARAHAGGAKGCTTFNVNGKRFGIMEARDEPDPEPGACFVDPMTGDRSCEE